MDSDIRYSHRHNMTDYRLASLNRKSVIGQVRAVPVTYVSSRLGCSC